MGQALALSTPSADPPALLGFGHMGAVSREIADRRMPTNEELNAWMQSVATAADRQAFAALFRHFAPRLNGFLLRGGADHALAEELTQETMVALWRRAATFDPQRAQLSTWLYTIARNLRIDRHRRAAGGESLIEFDHDGEEQPDDDDGPDERLIAAQREIGVRRALETLPPEQALVLRLSFFDDHPHSRIAEDLGIPLGTVKSRIRLAVTQLRRLLDRYQP
jgi:RNA polymerase sigma-70 factor (ECF subfamily)